MNNYQFYNNYSINQGYGWGYDARPDPDAAAHILFWGYRIETTDISFNNNVVYNPRRIYFIERNHGTVPFFRDNNYIKSDNNTYYMTEDATIFDYMYDVSEKDDFIRDYGKETNSTFNTIEIDQNIIDTANSSNSISNIKNLFANNINTIDPIPDLTGINFENYEYNITGPEKFNLSIKPKFQNAILPTFSKGIFIGNGLLDGFGNHGRASSGETDYYHYVHEALVNQNKDFTDSKVQGYAFEEVCLQHIAQIKAALGVQGVASQQSSWVVDGGEKEDGAQIDLLINRADRIINLCEMKFYGEDFTVDKSYHQKLDYREKVLTEKLSRKETVHPFIVVIDTIRKITAIHRDLLRIYKTKKG